MYKKASLVLGCILASSWAQVCFPLIAEAEDPVATSFQLVKSAVTLHEPILVKFSVRNELSEMLQFDLGPNREHKFRFTVSNPSKTTSEVSPPPPWGISRIGKIRVPPGESYSQQILLNKWYGFDQPGTYTIEARLTAPMTTKSGKTVVPTPSKPMTISVQPLNEGQLKRTCQMLAAEAIRAKDVETALKAGEILSYIRDPIAVPYLVEVLQDGWATRHLAVEGLARIQTEAAVRAMIDALSDSTFTSRYPDIKALLEGRLRQIANTTADPGIRQMVAEALKR